jgi:hypothetical protein
MHSQRDPTAPTAASEQFCASTAEMRLLLESSDGELFRADGMGTYPKTEFRFGGSHDAVTMRFQHLLGLLNLLVTAAAHTH